MNRGPATFFFAPESPRPLALLRIALGLVLLVEAAWRWPFAVELYSSAGLPMPPFPGVAAALPVAGPAAAVALHSLLLFALAAVTLGWQTRVSLAVALVLLAWFSLLDLPATLTKYTAISLHLLFLLAWSRSGSAFSIDRWLSRTRHARCELGAAWPRRLMQVLVCAVYWGAAVTKLRLPDFATGDLLEFSLLSDRWGGTRLGLWLSTSPALVVLGSLATLAFELFFPVLVWVKRLRRPALVCAVLFHLALAATMNLGAFSFVMLAALLAFVEERDLRWIGVRATPSATTLPRWPVRFLAGIAAYGLLAAIAAFAGLAVQRSTGAGGVFGVKPAANLPVLDPAAVDVALAGQKPDSAHLVHRFDIGSRLGHRRTFGARAQFRRGMSVHALARFVLNDEPLGLEWLLVAPDGREVARRAHRLPAGTAYATIAFRLTDDAPAGRYRVILEIEGLTVGERTFHLADANGPRQP